MSDRLISRLWSSANAVAARVYDALPSWAQESVANVANLVPDGPPRTADSGDFVEPPTFSSATWASRSSAPARGRSLR